MRIRMTDEGRVFQGTALQVVCQMKETAFGADAMTPREYMDWLVKQAARIGVALEVSGGTDEERAASVLAAAEKAGLVSRL